MGDNVQSTGHRSIAIGDYSQATKESSTAIGVWAEAAGDLSIATGNDAKATGDSSIAIGETTRATGTNSVALGAHSNAAHNNEVNIGIWVGGIQDDTRTLSGLSAATHDDEAVNKKQLDDAIASVSGVTEQQAQQMADTAKADAVSSSKGYTDTAKTEAIDAANKYTDKAALEANEQVLQKANTYTDDKAGQTLKSANENTERRAVVAEKRSQAYTDERSASTLESANTYTNHRAVQAENNAVARSNNYTDNRFGELRKSLEHTEKRLNAGIAGVTALSSIPYAAGNKFSYGIGAGNYRDGNAVAAGVQFRVSQSTNVRLNISWDSAGNNATGVGIAGGW
ncbi:hypothetical protein D7O18_21610 [Salmonella enterica subsp. enterica serovar Muenchen]|nr:hypothetical protein [Salmonella enterica subsp. enterica serovar Muenchen]